MISTSASLRAGVFVKNFGVTLTKPMKQSSARCLPKVKSMGCDAASIFFVFQHPHLLLIDRSVELIQRQALINNLFKAKPNLVDPRFFPGSK
jgi:hypothetical protein